MCLKILFMFLEREGGREGEREGNMDVGEKHHSADSYTPPTGDLATTQACALTGNGTDDLSVPGNTPNPLSYTS